MTGITCMSLGGAGEKLVVLSGGVVESEGDVGGGGAANATLEFVSDGTTSPPGDLTSWYKYAPLSGIGNSFWFKAVRTEGSDPNLGDALGTWINGSTNPSWGQLRSGVGSRFCILMIYAATAADDGAIIDSAEYSLIATVIP